MSEDEFLHDSRASLYSLYLIRARQKWILYGRRSWSSVLVGLSTAATATAHAATTHSHTAAAHAHTAHAHTAAAHHAKRKSAHAHTAHSDATTAASSATAEQAHKCFAN